IFRRVGVPRLEILNQKGGSGQFRHSLMNIDCDLAKGRVSFGVRFHDGRTAKNATFICPYIEFAHRGRKLTITLRYRTFEPKMVCAAFRDAPLIQTKAKRFRRDVEAPDGTYWAVWQNSHMLGFASAVHALPYAPEHLVRLRIFSDSSGRLHQAFSEHKFSGPQS